MFRDVPGCSGMFRNVPCSWFYRRPQKDANARFYTRVGTPKYLITKPIENQVNIVTTLATNN